MAQRDYKAPVFNIRDEREFRASQVSGADTRALQIATAGDDQWAARMLENLGNQTAATMNKLADIEFQNLYLEGAAKAGVIESEQELEGNPLTRDWQVAGYRDTMGKLALADSEAQFTADLATLREKGPEDFQAYLSERRQKMLPGMAGMSREARAAAAGQMLLQDRAATKQWTAEHAKFIVEQKSRAVHTQVATVLNNLSLLQLQAANGDISQEAYQSKLQAAAGTIYGSIWMDNSWANDAKRQVTFDVMQRVLAQDQVDLYEWMSANKVPDGTEGGSTIVSQLDGDQQLRLAGQYREAYTRTSDKRSLYRAEQVANIEAQIDNGMYKGTYKELNALLTPMVLNDSMNGTKRQSILNKYLDKQYKNETDSGLFQAVNNGDDMAIWRSGKSPDEAMDAADRTLARSGASPTQRLQYWLQTGRNGFDAGYKRAGSFLNTSIRQIVDSKDGTVLPQHAEVFRVINDEVRKAEASGLANTRVHILSGLAPENRAFLEQVFRRIDTDADGKGGASLDEAIMQAKNAEVKDNGMSPSSRAGAAQETIREAQKKALELEPRGLISTFWNWITGDETDLKLRPMSTIGNADHWWGHSDTVQWYTEQSRTAVQAEINDVLLIRPSLSADEALNVAKANVSARVVKTEQGPLILPRNVNLQATFGVGPGQQAVIGRAIDGMLGSRVSGSRWQLSFAQGRLFAQEFDRDGMRVGNGRYIGNEEIKAKINEDTQAELVRANQRFGTGKKVETDGISVQYNGQNTAGAPADWMYEFRDNLVEHEGVIGTEMDDISGNTVNGKPIRTVGVGLASTNEFYPTVKDGKVSSEDATASFLNASDAAAKVGMTFAKDVGRENQAGFMLMSELAYQSGPAFATRKDAVGDRYRKFMTALQGKNVQAAQDAFKGTAAWYYSGNRKAPQALTKRQRSYLQLIQQAMKG